MSGIQHNNLIYAVRLHSNARKFIESAVKHASQEFSPDYTFAAVHLASALELLIKARLGIEDYSQLAKSANSVTIQKFDNGDFASVSVDECLRKLDQLGVFSLSNRQRRVLRSIQQLRNRSVHYIAPTENELKGALGEGMNLYIEIERKEFSFWDPPYQAKPLASLMVELSRFESFVLARLSDISELLRDSLRSRTRYLDECPHCFQDAIVINDGYFDCLYCGYENSIECEAENRSINRLINRCPECGLNCFANFREHTPLSHECLCCGYCEGPEPEWLDWDTQSEIPRLHSDRRSALDIIKD